MIWFRWILTGAFRQGLGDAGYVEGQTAAIERSRIRRSALPLLLMLSGERGIMEISQQ